MNDKKSFQALTWFAGGALAVLLAGTIMAWFGVRNLPPSVPLQPSPIVTIPGPGQAQLYWLRDAGNRLELVASPVALEPGLTAEQKLQRAFNEQLSNPATPANTSNAIPPGTRLLALTIKPDGVHLDLSGEFSQGGGSTAMIGRLAQVVYTATSLDPDAALWINVNGKPLELLGGEGLMVDQPMTRKIMMESLSAGEP
ncbi:GerMN domain-containing protein [Synechocystis sp. LKSZ1]|uniref:GerMN domain-containing protein n=1 Tax=Synechocystis sp. LKSZ1 TaxID=3144951 RepID=UPI00336BDC8E